MQDTSHILSENHLGFLPYKNGVIAESIYPKSRAYLADCMDMLRQTPDKYYDLSLVDPPYGIGFSDYERGGSGLKTKKRYTANGKKKWDSEVPNKEYFDQLFRVSRYQIVWGGNYFNLPPTQSFIFWYKQNPVPNFADGELAWTNYDRPSKCFDYRYYGNIDGCTSAKEKIHPTQKPVSLYDWIYSKYLPQGGKVLDTHLGSGSNRIAADKAGNIDFTAFEIDKDYFEAQEERFRLYKSQLKLAI